MYLILNFYVGRVASVSRTRKTNCRIMYLSFALVRDSILPNGVFFYYVIIKKSHQRDSNVGIEFRKRFILYTQI